MNKKNSIEKEEVVTVTVSSLSSEGDGVGHYEGMAVFVEGVLPGETARVKLDLVKKRYALGQCLDRSTDSPDRISPICPVFERCGGCSVMHLQYEQQLVAKKERVAHALQRIGGLENVEILPCLPSPQPLAYRNKVEFSVEAKELIVGLKEKKSDSVIDVEKCYIQGSLGDKVYQKVRDLLIGEGKIYACIKKVRIRCAASSGEVMVVFITDKFGDDRLHTLAKVLYGSFSEVKSVMEVAASNSGKVRCLTGQSFISESLDGLSFMLSATSFFQVNSLQAEQLYKTAIAFAEINKTKLVLDTYCGVGTLSLFAAQQAKQVVGIESHPQAIEDAKKNAANNGIENCTFTCGLTERLIGKYSNADIVMLNPPRAGCEKTVIDAIIRMRPSSVVYISCDPATLSRDLKLLHGGGFTIDAVQPVDMFPQTMHVETVVKLKTTQNSVVPADL